MFLVSTYTFYKPRGDVFRVNVCILQTQGRCFSCQRILSTNPGVMFFVSRYTFYKPRGDVFRVNVYILQTQGRCFWCQHILSTKLEQMFSLTRNVSEDQLCNIYQLFFSITKINFHFNKI